MEALFTLVVLLVLVASTVLWLWALVDVARRSSHGYRRGGPVLWTLVVAVAHAAGAIAYLALGRPSPARQAGAR